MKTVKLIVTILIFVSCEKAFIEPSPYNSPQANFDALFETVKNKYSFFTLKGIDWDSVRTYHQPRIYAEMPDEELFDVLADMLYALEDGHVNLFAPFNTSRNWEWYLGFPENFKYEVVERNYLKEDHRRSGPLLNTVIDSVGYVYYGSFSQAISGGNINAVLTRFKNLKGVVIDVRNNGGGNLANAFLMASRFADERRHVYTELQKTGPGPNDFGFEEKIYIQPGGQIQFTKPVVVLTNRKCYSATTFFVALMREMPHVTILGDNTGGGGGLPYFSELPNGWTYRFSVTQSIAADGTNLEPGLPPDVTLNLDENNLSNGVDDLIEAALNLLR